MSTIKGIFGPFRDFVQKQLEHRKNIVANARTSDKPENFYTYTIQKACVIRMSSGVNLSKENDLIDKDNEHEKNWVKDDLARNYILQNGISTDDRIVRYKDKNIPFTNEEEGNEFRGWVNDTYPDYAKDFDLDREGSFNNDYISDAWKGRKTETTIGRGSGDRYYKRKGVWYHENGHKVDPKLFKQYQYNEDKKTYITGPQTSTLSNVVEVRKGFVDFKESQFGSPLKEGIGEGGAYGDSKIRADAGDGYGIVAMPGIVDADIRTKSDDGSLREAKINWVCHNRRQLEVLEALYMRPGYAVLLEWGWSPYISNPTTANPHGSIEDFPDPLDEWFDENSDMTRINLEIVKRKSQTGGNYDGFVGIIKNFTYKSTSAGGFNCTTELIAAGETLESLKSAKLTVPASINFTEEEIQEQQQETKPGKTEVIDRFLYFLRSIKHALDKAGDEKYIDIHGTDYEYESMYESWDNYWAEFLWWGDGSTSGPLGGGKNNLEDWEDGNQTEKIYIAGFQGIKQVVRDTMKMSMSKIEAALENDATEQKLGYDSLLFGTIIKQNSRTKGRENEDGKEVSSGISKDIYVRWDLICQLINHLCIPSMNMGKEAIAEFTYLNANERTWRKENKRRIKTKRDKFYLEYSTPETDLFSIEGMEEHDLYYGHITGEGRLKVLGQSCNPNVCLMPHSPQFQDLMYKKAIDYPEVDNFVLKETIIKSELTSEYEDAKFYLERQDLTSNNGVINSEPPVPVLNPNFDPNKPRTDDGVLPAINVKGYGTNPMFIFPIDISGIYNYNFIADAESTLIGTYIETSQGPVASINLTSVQETVNANSVIQSYESANLGDEDEGLENYTNTVIPFFPDEFLEYGYDGMSGIDLSQQQKKDLEENFMALSGYTNTKFSSKSIGMVYFNLDHIIGVYQDMRLEKKKIGEEEVIRLRDDFNFLEYISKIWDDVNEACGGYYDFSVHMEHERPHVARIVDLTVDGSATGLFTFDPQGLRSITRDFNFSSKISSDMSSMISIAAQSPKDAKSLDALSFKSFHRNVENRFSSKESIKKKDNGEKEAAKLEMEQDISQYQNKLDTLLAFRDQIGRFNFLFKKEGNVSIDKALGIVQDIEELQYSINMRFPLLKLDGKTPHPKAGQYNMLATNMRSSIIPLEFNIQMDGISGINPLQMFKIASDKLPRAYQRDDVAFIIKGESQKITSGQDWVSEFNGQLTLLDTDKIEGKNKVTPSGTKGERDNIEADDISSKYEGSREITVTDKGYINPFYHKPRISGGAWGEERLTKKGWHKNYRHTGVDLGPAKSSVSGDPLLAMCDGKITHIKSNLESTSGCGGDIKIKCEDGVSVRFCHCWSDRWPKNPRTGKVWEEDDPVKQGEVIAYMGGNKKKSKFPKGYSSADYPNKGAGGTSGTHLHLEISDREPNPDWWSKLDGGRISLGKTYTSDPVPYLKGIATIAIYKGNSNGKTDKLVWEGTPLILENNPYNPNTWDDPNRPYDYYTKIEYYKDQSSVLVQKIPFQIDWFPLYNNQNPDYRIQKKVTLAQQLYNENGSHHSDKVSVSNWDFADYPLKEKPNDLALFELGLSTTCNYC